MHARPYLGCWKSRAGAAVWMHKSTWRLHRSVCVQHVSKGAGSGKSLYLQLERGDLGALSSDENAAVDETAPISAADMYEGRSAQSDRTGRKSVVTNEVLDVVICDTSSCGDCDIESTGCQRIYAITKTAAGSVGQPADIVHTIDGGATWYADDIDSLAPGKTRTRLAVWATMWSWCPMTRIRLHYALKSEIDDLDFDETWLR